MSTVERKNAKKYVNTLNINVIRKICNQNRRFYLETIGKEKIVILIAMNQPKKKKTDTKGK